MNRVLCAVLAGFIAFAWSAFSWMVLPFHNKTMNSVNNELIVAEVLQATIVKNGIYVIPSPARPDKGLSEEEKKGLP